MDFSLATILELYFWFITHSYMLRIENDLKEDYTNLLTTGLELRWYLKCFMIEPWGALEIKKKTPSCPVCKSLRSH